MTKEIVIETTGAELAERVCGTMHGYYVSVNKDGKLSINTATRNRRNKDVYIVNIEEHIVTEADLRRGFDLPDVDLPIRVIVSVPSCMAIMSPAIAIYNVGGGANG